MVRSLDRSGKSGALRAVLDALSRVALRAVLDSLALVKTS
jgi:hypothetical protein